MCLTFCPVFVDHYNLSSFLTSCYKRLTARRYEKLLQGAYQNDAALQTYAERKTFHIFTDEEKKALKAELNDEQRKIYHQIEHYYERDHSAKTHFDHSIVLFILGTLLQYIGDAI
jgi:hypothetical protein